MKNLTKNSEPYVEISISDLKKWSKKRNSLRTKK